TIRIERWLAQLRGVLFLRRLQPEAAAKATLRRPHQIETSVFLRALCRIGKHFSGVFVAALPKGHVAQTRTRGSPKASRLAKTRDHRQRAAAGLKCVLKMLARSFQIVVPEREPAQAQFVCH